MEVIRSRQNSLLQQLHLVAQGKRTEEILLEGERLVLDAILAGVQPRVVFLSEGVDPKALLEAGLPPAALRLVAKDLLQRASQLRSCPGLLALAPPPAEQSLTALAPQGRDLVLVVCGVGEPGNLGALARAAEGAGARALVLAGQGVHPMNPKCLRGSMGSLLRLDLVREADPGRVARTLAELGWRQAKAATRAGQSWREFDFKGPLALWINGETGQRVPAMDDLAGITIPLAGRAESLNVAVAGALLLFAAGRSGE